MKWHGFASLAFLLLPFSDGMDDVSSPSPDRPKQAAIIRAGWLCGGRKNGRCSHACPGAGGLFSFSTPRCASVLFAHLQHRSARSRCPHVFIFDRNGAIGARVMHCSRLKNCFSPHGLLA